MLRSLFVALHFLTRLPLSAREMSLEEVGRAAWAFPAVGVLIGGLLTGAGWLLGHLFPPLLVAALVLAFWVAVTGALHLDGFVDCCDALLAARPPEVRLEILRDTHVGAFGVIGAAMLLLVKFAALEACISAGQWAVLLLAPSLGRWAMVYTMARYPSARSTGMGQAVKGPVGGPALGRAPLLPLPMLLTGPLGPMLIFPPPAPVRPPPGPPVGRGR